MAILRILQILSFLAVPAMLSFLAIPQILQILAFLAVLSFLTGLAILTNLQILDVLHIRNAVLISDIVAPLSSQRSYRSNPSLDSYMSGGRCCTIMLVE